MEKPFDTDHSGLPANYMAIQKRILVVFFATLISGCASAPPRPQLSGIYLEPAPTAIDTATVTGTLKKNLIDSSRARLEGIDGIKVSKGPRIPAPILVKSGVRQLALICETEFDTGSAWISLAVDIKAGHSYVLRCEEQSSFANIGTDFKVEDKSEQDRVVASGSSWGPSHGPRGRAF